MSAAPAIAAQPFPLNYKTFSLGGTDASLSGTTFGHGALTLTSSGLSTVLYTDPFANANVDGSGSYQYGTWTSAATSLFPFNELVSSWNAKTPAGTWIQVEVQPQMDVGYWAAKFPGAGYAPSAAETSWAPYADPWVDYTARYVFDYHYDGAGNWPFNAAYGAARGLVGDVTQLHNLAEAEPFIRAGIPLVASVAWNSNKLDTAIKSTNGHLLVIEGFTGDGSKVIVNDPASPDDASVKHYYDREQFEKAWIPASGGIVYVIRPAGWQTPSLTANNS